MQDRDIFEDYLNKKIVREEALELMRRNTVNLDDGKKLCTGYPLSAGQEGLYTLFCMDPDSCAYNTPGAFQLQEQVEESVLEQTLLYLVDRHTMLRSYFRQENDMIYRMVKEHMKLKLERYSLIEGETMSDRLEKERAVPFHLEKPPLFRAVLVTGHEGEKVLFLNFHHIIFDGFSACNFLDELKQTYRDLLQKKNISLFVEEDKYSEFTREESEYLRSEKAASDSSYWLKQLEGSSRLMKVRGKALETGESSNDGSCYMEYLDPEILSIIKNLRFGKPATLAAKMLAAYMLVLFRLSGERDLKIGIPVTNRGSKYDRAIGYYINIIVIRYIIEVTDTFEQVVGRVQRLIYDGIEHGRYPYSHLIKDVSSKRKKIEYQLFQSAFYFNQWPDQCERNLIAFERDDIHQTGEYDLAMELLEEGEERLLMRIKYNQSLFSAEDAKAVMMEYKKFLLELSKGLGIQADENREDVLFPELFYRQVKNTPNAAAVVFDGESLSYIQLYKRAKSLAQQLKQAGVKKGAYVGVLLYRSPDLLTALIAVMMSGGAYIPLDPQYPSDRLQYMLEQSGLKYLIIEPSSKRDDIKKAECEIVISHNQIPNGRYDCCEREESISIQADDLAYILFTSGSTGNPKGILISHGALANFLISMAEMPGCSSSDYLLAVTTISFDISALEMFLMLTVGGTVEIIKEEMARDGISLLEKLEESPATIMQATPATWQMLLAAGWSQKKNLKVLCGGEALTRELGDLLLDRAAEVWNMYGPTETTVWSMVCRVEKNAVIHLGEPIRNTTIYILDDEGNPVEDDEIGELYIGGEGVAKGYLNNPKETAKRFVFSELENGIIYKTGDLVKRTQSDEILYMGRKDFQVKLNGFRIELGDIEENLLKLDGIGQAVVILDGKDETKYLSAYLIAKAGMKAPESDEIRAYLNSELPEYMIPAQFHYVEEYPLTLNGKVDRKRLGRQGSETNQQSVSMKESHTDTGAFGSNELQQFIAGEMARILRISKEEILPDKNLGEYGFDSITFTKLCVSMNNRFRIKLKPTIFYSHQNLKSLCQYISEQYQPVRVLSKSFCTAVPKTLEEVRDGIAVIGLGGRFPGAFNPQEYWQNLINQKDLITEIPPDRYDWTKYYEKEESDPNRISSKWGGFIADVDKFDAEFFKISPREAELMDPQQRLMLEIVWQAIENAGYNPRTLAGKNVGVFVGATSTDYMEILLRESEVKAHTITGISNSIIANRISYCYDFKGPSEVIDTACSSSLVSVNRAVEAIRNGSCDYAVAGGVNLLLSPFPQIGLSKSSMLSTDGSCKAFDESANGYVRGEGAAAFLLKPLKRARADMDHVYAVIKGIAVNHSGKTNSLTAPNPAAQSQLLQKAFADAGYQPDEVSYIETHGTGTALGDPIEIEGIRDAFETLCKKNGINYDRISCSLGSVKTNIGHLEAASGAASLMKLVLALEHKVLPATLHQKKENPYIDFANGRFHVQKRTEAWKNPLQDGKTLLLKGGVSAFGFGGTNAHLLVEESVKTYPEESTEAEIHAVVLSADYEQGVTIYAEKLFDFLSAQEFSGEKEEEAFLKRMSYTLQTGRPALKYRAAFLVRGIHECRNSLEQYLARPVSDTVLLPGIKMENLSQGSECYRNLAETTVRWVNGEDVGWAQFYRAVPEKLPLPTYPFQNVSYWVPVTDKNKMYGPVKKQPLIDGISASFSLGDGLVYEKILSSNDRLIKDHKVNGTCVMSGTGYLELGAEAVGEVFELQAAEFSQVVWNQQAVFMENLARKIYISIQQDNDGYIYQVRSGSNREILHGSGQIRPAAKKGEEKRLPVAEIKERCPQFIPGRQFYQLIAAEAGIEYGEYYQAIEGIQQNSMELLGTIKLSRELYSEQKRYFIHPVVMDCALQAMAGLMRTETDGSQTKIPFLADEITVYRALREKEYYVHVTQKEEGCHDIVLADKEGWILSVIQNLVSRSVQTEEPPFFVPIWTPISPDLKKQKKETGEPVAVVYYNRHSEEVKNQLSALLNPEKTIFCLQKLEEDDIQFYTAIEKYPSRIIYYLTGLIPQSNSSDSGPEFMEYQNRGIRNFFRLLRFLQKIPGKTELCVITDHINSISGEGRIIPVNAGIAALSKTAMIENPNLLVRCYDFEGMDLCDRERLLKIRNRQGWKEELCITKYGCYEKQIVKLNIKQQNGRTVFQNGGVYLIAGMGGIGQAVGCYLAEIYHAVVIYVSRSPKDREREQVLDKIAKMGGGAYYIQADITDGTRMAGLNRRLDELGFGSINGLIFAAMVLSNEKLSDMTDEMFDRVMAPKAQGTMTLFQALKAKISDFALVLSSASALVGNYGQGNYCAACACQDAIAAAMRSEVHFPVQVINWSYWGSTGAVSDGRYQEQLLNLGLYPIGTKEGLKMMEQILSSGLYEAVVCKAGQEAWKNMGFKYEKEIEQYPEEIPYIRTEASSFPKPTDDIYALEEGFQKLEQAGACLILDYFRRNQIFNGREGWEPDKIARKLQIVSTYRPLLNALLWILLDCRYIKQSGVGFELCEQPVADVSDFDRLTADYPKLIPFSRLMQTCASRFEDVLSGKTDYTNVMFPGGSKELVEGIYKGNCVVDYFNTMTAEVVRQYVEERMREDPDCSIRILEIGAGTGGTSIGIFQRLNGYFDYISYTYSDISPSFTRFGEQHYAEKYPFITFRVLNIEDHPSRQGYEKNSYDIIVAANVLHATADISNTLKHMKYLLKKNGIAVINEITSFKVFSTITFGLTDGWWKFRDECRMDGAPLLSEAAWEEKLLVAGYQGVKILPGYDVWREATQHVIVAASNGRVEHESEKIAAEGRIGNRKMGEKSSRQIRLTEPESMTADNMRQKVLPETVLGWLREEFSMILKLDLNQIDDHRKLDDLGLDSLLIIEVNRSWNQIFPGLPSTTLFEHNTLASLAEYLMKHYQEQLQTMLNPRIQINPELLETTDELSVNGAEETETKKEPKPELEPQQLSEPADIAIIGIAGRYPGAEGIEEFWENLYEGREIVTEIPADRWDYHPYVSSEAEKPGKIYSRWGAFLNDVYAFDPSFFEISEEQAANMDPQERLMMEVVWELLEDSGYPYQALAEEGKTVGTYLGIMYSDYETLAAADRECGFNEAQSSHWLIPNRIAAYYDFRGPCMAVDTACSSSLTAIHLACQSLKAKESDVAVAGGVNLILDVRHYLRLSALHNLSSSPQTRSFGEGGDGFVVGEGIGAVLLKPLKNAIEDNDRIYGVIKGTGVNANGATSSFMAASPSAQEELIKKTLEKSGINAGTIGCIEAHGTGTGFGDAIEIRGLEKAFAHSTKDQGFCSVGSVKSYIGHLEAAAGISALTKVLLQMKYRKLLPVHDFQKLSSYIQLENSPFFIQEHTEDWKRITIGQTEYPRRAGISSFGAGGSNAHILLEEFEKGKQEMESDQPELFPVSARNREQLTDYVKKIKDFLVKNPDLNLGDLAYSLQISKQPMQVRLAVVSSDREDLIESLDYFLQGIQNDRFCYAENHNNPETAAKVPFHPAGAKEIRNAAELWTKGMDYAWRASYKGNRNLISLPGYPFHKNVWTMKGQVDTCPGCYYYSFEDDYIKDHVSFGENVLLGTTHLSLAVESLSGYTKKGENIKIHKFLLVEPVVLKQNETVEITIEIDKSNGSFRSLYRKNKTNGFRTAAEGKFEFLAPEQKAANPAVSDLPLRCGIPGSDIYDKKWPGIYGKSLQTIEHAGISGNLVYACLQVTTLLKKDGRCYQVPPAILDAAIVSRCALLKEQGDRTPMLPFMVKNLIVFDQVPDQCISVLEKVRENEEIWELNIKIYDCIGKLLVDMEGVILKNSRDELKNMLYAPGRKKEASEAMPVGDQLNYEHAVENYIIEKLSAVVPDSLKINVKKNFMDMGVDSRQLVALAKDMETDLGAELYPTLFFEYPNILQLSGYLTQNYADSLSKVLHREVPAAAEDGDFNLKPSRQSFQKPVAIIGISGIMPGCDNLDEFFNALVDQEELITEIPKDRWDWKAYYKGDSEDSSKTNIVRAGFMKEVDQFDHRFFSISPREADLMDPQQRLSLQLVWELLEDAGYNPKDLSGSNTGVFIGVSGHDYNDLLKEHQVDSRSQALTGNAHNILTGRISYLLNLLGPSEPVDTACSSGLVAIHRGIQNINDNTCDMVIAGGINLITHPSLFISFDSIGILSSDGICRAFDQDASGTVRGEGAGFVLLKSLEHAIRDQDHIYAVIRGSAVNHGGHASSLTAPNVKQQAAVITEAIKKSGLPPETITYIETHGTGTKLGDPVEISGLKEAFGTLWGSKKEFSEENCALGTLKSNIGHLESASGMASLIKILLCMKHGVLPGNINFHKLNPYAQTKGSPFYLPRSTRKWSHLMDEEGREIPYRAGVSSFGFSGVNAHLTLEEYQKRTMDAVSSRGQELILLSARGKDELQAYAGLLKCFLESHLGNSCRTGRERKQLISLISEILSMEEEDIREDMTLGECGFDAGSISFLADQIRELYGTEPECGDMTLDTSICKVYQILGFADQGEKNIPPVALPDLCEIAYTLQTGRPAFPMRAAFLADNLKELISKLSSYLAHDSSACGIYEGIAADDNAETMESEVQEALTHRHLDALARLWTKGAKVDGWEQLYDTRLQKVSLPTYPFRRDRHWIKTDKKASDFAASEQKSRLTEFIDCNTSDIHGIQFEKTITKEAWFMQEHQLDRVMTLPGVVYLEMACMATTLADRGKAVTELYNVVFSRPVTMEHSEKKLFVRLKYEKGWHFEISEGTLPANAAGEIICGEMQMPGSPADIQEVLKACTGSMEQKEFYQGFEEKGFHYGPRFKPVRKINYCSDKAVSVIERNASGQEAHHSYVLDPLVLEGALQTAGYLINTGNTEPLIPFGIEGIRRYRALPQRCFAIASISEPEEKTGVKHADILIVDENGGICAEINNYVARRKNGRSKSSYLKPVWVPEAAVCNSAGKSDAFYVLLSDQRSDMKDFFENSPADYMVVRSGQSTGWIRERYFEMNLSEDVALEKLLKAMESSGCRKAEIINLWMVEKIYLETTEAEEQYQKSIRLLSSLSQLLHRSKLISSVRYLFVYEKSNPFAAAMNGFLKSLHLETSGLSGTAIGISVGDPIEPVVREVLQSDTVLEVMYDKGKRYIKSYKEIKDPASGSSRLRHGGTYWITGGMGGVGYAIAAYLVKKYKVNVVLNGRSALNEEIGRRLEELNHAGGRAVYMSGDLCRKEQVIGICQEIKKKFGTVNGIFHCAGILEDRLLVHKSWPEMKEILEPKVEGVRNIDEATKQEALDFLFLFSSITAELGNIGQCDYAYANSFMDAYAFYRESLRKQNKRKGDTISVNWPLIGSGTMKAARNNWGFKALEWKEFTAALETLAASGSGQIMLLHGDEKQYRSLFQNQKKTRKQDPTFVPVKQDRKTEMKRLKKELIRLVSAISHMEEEQISETAVLDDYGFDSVVITEFTNELRKQYDISVTPSVFYEIPELSVDKLSDYLYREYGESIEEKFGNSVSTEPAAAAHELRTERKEVLEPANEKEETAVLSGVAGNDTVYEPIAIIGMAGKMPQAGDLEEYWELLEGNKNAITEVPKDRWNWQEFYGNPIPEGKTLCKWGGFLKDAGAFDAKFFKISPNEAVILDPQQRLVLEAAWKSVEHAGYAPSSIRGTKTGVFIGASNSDYAELYSNTGIKNLKYAIGSNAHFLIANRVSHFMDLHGPSETVDTACSSAAVAIHRAVTALHNGECSLALAGGVNILASVSSNIRFDAFGMLSHDGKVKTFDKAADGFIRSEGVGMIVLKPLKEAVKDQDTIHAVIMGSAAAHCGTSKSVISPNPNGESEVIMEAMKKCGISPEQIDYIELQGAGSLLGDPIEVSALSRVFENMSDKKDRGESFCMLGSVKTNMGHLEAASAMAGIFKVILSMKHQMLPASINCSELNPYLELEKNGFHYLTENMEWKTKIDKDGNVRERWAGINVFGAGGTNVHLILKEYRAAEVLRQRKEQEELYLFSARTRNSLHKVLKKMTRYLEKNPEINLEELSYTLKTARDQMDYRFAVKAGNLEELLERLRETVKDPEFKQLQDHASYGRVSASDRTLFELMDMERIQKDLITDLMDHGNLEKLAALWTRGLNIDWDAFYDHKKEQRTEAPTYCFDSREYWITAPDPVEKEEVDPVEPPLEPSSEVGNFMIRTIREFLENDELIIGEQDQLNELGFDSIMYSNLKYKLETELNIEIPISDITVCATVMDFVKLLKDKGVNKIKTGTLPIVQGREKDADLLFQELNISELNEEEVHRIYDFFEKSKKEEQQF